MAFGQDSSRGNFAGIRNAFIAIVLFIVVIVLASSFGTIDAGHRGVLMRLGKVSDNVIGEGFYTKMPFIDSVIYMDVRIQKEQVETECASKDLQSVKTTIALNLRVDPAKSASIYQSIGPDYLSTIVAPSMQESIKSVIAQYTAEELISRREVVREGISALLQTKLAPIGIQTEGLNIVNFEFSPSFNQAIEAKVTAEQNALASKNLLAQKEFEAQQAVAIAKGKAEAMKIESESLKASPQILQLRIIEKWDGVLPRVSSGAVPFVDVNGLLNTKQ